MYEATLTINEEKKEATLSDLAVESLSLDVVNSKLIFLHVKGSEGSKSKGNIYVTKSNGSLCDDNDVIKELLSPEKIRSASIDSESMYGVVPIDDTTIETINDVFPLKKYKSREFKLIEVNDPPLLSGLREDLSLQFPFHKLVPSEVNTKTTTSESINESINQKTTKTIKL